MKKLFLSLSTFALLLLVFMPVFAQGQPTAQPSPSPSTEELEKQKAAWQKEGYRLLEEVISEAQALRLTENRVRVQINAADMLWEQDQSRARSLFAQAGDGVAELMRNQDQNQRRNGPRGPNQLRNDLVLTAARHDAPLAYQLLAVTRPATPVQPANQNARNAGPGPGQLNPEDFLEQALLSRVASLDPKLAAQNADQMLEKGQFPRSITDVITNLRKQDEEAANKLQDKTIKRLQSANILTSNDAASLAMALVNPGPRPAANSTDATQKPATDPSSQPRTPFLDQSTYTDLLSTVVDAALKANPTQSTNQRTANQRGGRQGGPAVVAVANGQTQPTDEQLEQMNSRRLLSGLQQMLPQIDQYLPARSQAVRQKLTDLGMGNSRQSFVQAMNQMANGDATADSLVKAAAAAPPQMQSRIYQQAATKAIDEGNPDQARQIATDYLQGTARDAVMQRIEFRELSKKAENAQIEEIRQQLARVPSDNDRVDLLLRMSDDVSKSNPKLAKQVLEEAKTIAGHRATSYDSFEQQLKVAHAFAAIDPARSFEILDPGINHLNELMAAAAVLNGFEVNIFRDGELPIQGGSGLSSTVSRYGQELALLAKTDFERSEMLAGHFQLPEPRIMVRLSIVQGLLGVEVQQQNTGQFRGFGGFRGQ